MSAVRIKLDPECENTWLCELVITVEAWIEGDTALEQGFEPQDDAYLIASLLIFLEIMTSSSQLSGTRNILAHVGTHIFKE